MVGPQHPREFRHRHVAADAFVAGSAGFVMRVGGGVFHLLLVTRQAGVVCHGRLLEAVAPARCVAMNAVQPARPGARVHPPPGVGVVLSQVAPVRIEIRGIDAHQVEVVEVALAGRKAVGQGRHLRMAGGAQGVALLDAELPGDDQLDVRRRRGIGRHPAKQPCMTRRRPVARLTVDAGLSPLCLVAVALEVVVLRELADVAAEARRVERELPLLPVKRLVAPIAEMPHRARGRVEPFPPPHVVGHRQHLQPAPIQRREEIVNVLAAHHLDDRVLLLPFGAALDYDALLDISQEPVLAGDDLGLLRG